MQPVAALPDGASAVGWRATDESIFNSPDEMCLERVGSVSLLCRGVAMGRAPTDRIVLRLPYQHWAYLASTGGKDFTQ
jgi:hypothetical protein